MNSDHPGQFPVWTPYICDKYNNFSPSTSTSMFSKHTDGSTSACSIVDNQPRLVDMIGYQNLLSSLTCLTPQVRAHNQCSKLNDRFIPNRKSATNNYLLREDIANQQNQMELDPQRVSITEIYSQEILGSRQEQSTIIEPFHNRNILQYCSKGNLSPKEDMIIGSFTGRHRRVRKINRVPCKVLDAPALQDDFYLNLIDWSGENILAVGLGSCIYLWNAYTSKVTKLCELQDDITTSVAWSVDSGYLSIGCNRGEVLIWDVQRSSLVKKLTGHVVRVGAMAWSSSSLVTGSRDKVILQRDIRISRDAACRMVQHNQQVCGLKWSLDEQYLASGGNDNKVAIWTRGGQLANKFTDHRAAVKALAWSPHQHGVLATGGGTADKMLKLRNVFTGKIIAEKDTGSQICNIAFSKSLHEIVSTHGYSQNEINIWGYPNMKRMATLVGHSHRVLYLSMSPDGSTLVTGAGDETLRFWNIFPTANTSQCNEQATSNLEEGIKLR